MKFFASAEYEFDLMGGQAFARYDYTYTDGYYTHPENSPLVREVEKYDTHMVDWSFFNRRC